MNQSTLDFAINRLAREVSGFVRKVMEKDGIGTGEMAFLHVVRRHPGIIQAQIREMLHLDKGAAARRAASLENKGFLVRIQNPLDKRISNLHATKKADQLKHSNEYLQGVYYDWLLKQIEPTEREQFLKTLNHIAKISDEESDKGFPNLLNYLGELEETKREEAGGENGAETVTDGNDKGE